MPGKHYDLDTDITLSNNDDKLIPSQKAVKTYVDTEVDKKADPTIIRDSESEVSVKELVINKLTNEEYDVAVKEDDQLYLTPDTTDQDIADAINTHNTSNSAHSSLFNAKQDKLTTQTAYTSKGTSSKVPQITTNTLGQVTNITEVTITQPTVNNNTITIQKNSTTVDSFTLNQSTDKTINISVPTTVAELSDSSNYVQTSSLEEAATVAKTGSYNDLLDKPTIPQGTVTSVRVQATSPVVSSQNTAQTGTLNTTISLTDGYGDTKNPYGSKTTNTVLAAPNGSNGAPSFRALVKADIPLASETAENGGTTTSLVTTGEKYTWNSKQDALSTQTAYTSKGSATKVPQITTNTLGQVTAITEVTITQPTVNNKTITIQKNSTTVDSFTLNQSTDKTINITVPTKTSDITNDSGFLTAESDTLGTVLNRGNSATTDINMNNKDWFNSGVKLTSYYYSTSQTPNTQFYWYKLEPPTSGSKADRYFISIDSDVNYPQNRATFLLDISKYSTNSYNVSLNCLAMTGGTGTHVLNVAIDADGYVYVQSDAVWSSYMRFVRYGTESSTISYTQVGLAAFGTADGFTPVKMIQDTGCIRLVDGALSGTYYTLIPSNYFRGDLKGNADTATKATKDADGNTISTTYLKSHQSIKSLKTDNTTAQTASSSEAIAGSGTINLHKISKTGSYNDLLNKPTIPTVNDATLTIQQNGTTLTTFSANASSAATANIVTTVVKFRDWSAS